MDLAGLWSIVAVGRVLRPAGGLGTADVGDCGSSHTWPRQSYFDYADSYFADKRFLDTTSARRRHLHAWFREPRLFALWV